ncbi:hypothetical protein HN51_003143 [Arachis hypogaea]|uniref:protein MIS12 homolog n=1 Tax=Arachis hypogaea TaxID=3818 RepID=UPI000DEC4289|nr:protein MIS12 homolog [Arachis hypogaea]
MLFLLSWTAQTIFFQWKIFESPIWRENGRQREAIFESLNPNPQLFLNEIRNTLDNVVDEAFDFFHQEASTKLNYEGSIQRSEDLKKGVDCVWKRIQSVLDNRLAIWEKYFLLHCFAVLQGLHMPNTVGKEFDEVSNHEIQILEKQSTVNAHYINERYNYMSKTISMCYFRVTQELLFIFIFIFGQASTKLYH